MDHGVNFLQNNMQHSKGATSVISRHIAVGQIHIYLLQEPWVYKGRVRGLGQLDNSLYYKRDPLSNPRTCIFVDKGIERFPLAEFCHRDLVALKVLLKDREGRSKPIVVCSAYFPYDSDEGPYTGDLAELVRYCRREGLPLVVGCDANAHHLVWGSKDTNSSGQRLLEYLNSTDLEILNRGSTPTFVTKRRQEVIDLTLSSLSIASEVCEWRVSDEPSLSDHRHIRFRLLFSSGSKPESFRDPKSTNWVKYVESLRERLDAPLKPCRRTWQVEETAVFMQNAIVTAYEDSCKLRTFRGKKRTPWWNSDLERIRKNTRRLLNRAMRTKLPADWESYRDSQRRYKDLIRRSKRDSWRTYCENLEGLPQASRIFKVLSKDQGLRVGSIRLPSGRHAATAEEALDRLLEIHFPGSEALLADEAVEEASRIGVRPMDWKIASKVVTEDKLKWAINTFSPFKSAGPDDIFPALLQKGLDILVPHLLRLLRACLALGYIPTSWRMVRVAFIPKPGRRDYDTAKDFRPISLSSFLLKTEEKLLDVYIKQEVLGSNPLHSGQHAYRVAMSTETALHSLVTKLEGAVHQKEVALGVFLDIEGAFNNTTFDSISNSARSFGIDDTIIRWIRSMLESRIISTSLGSVVRRVTVARGCPQGGVLSPLLWSLVMDGLIRSLNEGGAYGQGYADDLAIVVTGKFPNTVKEVMQRSLRTVEGWCRTHDLSVNPLKTEVVPFTNKRKLNLDGLHLFGENLVLSESVRYLGVVMDSRLTWGNHIDRIVQRATASLWACRRALGSTWGLRPKTMHWIYTAVIRPMITYGALVWWPAMRKAVYQKRLKKLQRFASIGITGALRTTPTSPLEAILGLEPLHLVVEASARTASVRLNDWGRWVDRGRTFGHARIWADVTRYDPCLRRRDSIPPECVLTREYQTLIPDRDQWLQAVPSFLKPQGLLWFTDGSKTEEGTGAGIYGDRPKWKTSFPLGRYTTVFQAEIAAITACAQENLRRGYFNLYIYICSDSQAAIKALGAPSVRSALVRDCKRTLDELGKRNRVKLVWVPGHSGVSGNEEADQLAREGSSTPFVGPEPAFGLAADSIKSSIRNWTCDRFLEDWNDQEGLRQSRIFLTGPLSRSESETLLKLERRHLRAFVGVLTGHWRVNYHLYTCGSSDSPVCRFCSEVDETTEHVVCECDALVNHRLLLLGDRFLSPEEVRQVRPSKLYSFLSRIGLSG